MTDQLAIKKIIILFNFMYLYLYYTYIKVTFTFFKVFFKQNSYVGTKTKICSYYFVQYKKCPFRI